MFCDVCGIIVEICSARFEEYDDEILGQVSAVLNSTCPHAQSLQRAATFDVQVADFPDALLAIKKDVRKTGINFGLAHMTPDDQIIFDNVSITSSDLVFRDQIQHHPGQAILPDREWIDLDVVRGWMSTCHHQHGVQCHEPSWLKGVDPTKPERLIDVVQNCIVAPPGSGIRYVALSYTWGLGKNLKNTKSTLLELQQLNSLNSPHFAAQLPETIKNTIDLVKELGERFLWVDALCIIQDEPASLVRNLNQMQLIYASSVFCIMASTGCGAEFGLRGLKGLSPARNLELYVYDLADGERLIEVDHAVTQDPTAGTKYSYHQRGWTFQEWLFSRRRLVFNHGPLIWQCQCARWRETSRVNPEADSRWALNSRARESALDPSPSIWDFMSLVPGFNTKSLTMQEDAPRAFAGIQAMLHRVHPGGLLYGLSEFFFEVALAWSSLYDNVERRQGSDGSKGVDDGLPSWSWLGWSGRVNFPHDAEFHVMDPWHSHEQKVGFDVPVVKWYTMASPDSLTRRAVRSQWHQYKMISQRASTSAEIPSEWTREEYKRQDFPHDFNAFGREPIDLFSHRLDHQKKFKYAIPVLNWSDTPVLGVQTQYLGCETNRARLMLTSGTSIMKHVDNQRRIGIQDDEGNLILSLTLHNTKEVQDFLDDRKGFQAWMLVSAILSFG
ncbi:heterokaryon incompatibility protein [Fusarium heterosporum]|uniref:Heterokaryon incompatibility protein n=1 Tax=Fusarium heterosporum TaxID=42747 RepID=A0A8H5WYH7_FUSHE|nr:heterokaryon incompatibility protein [Fusarium heterosporum]